MENLYKPPVVVDHFKRLKVYCSFPCQLLLRWLLAGGMCVQKICSNRSVTSCCVCIVHRFRNQPLLSSEAHRQLRDCFSVSFVHYKSRLTPEDDPGFDIKICKVYSEVCLYEVMRVPQKR